MSFACAYPAATLAIDRLHRVTQERTVYVKHFIVRCSPLLLREADPDRIIPQIENTIEARILQIQKRKTAIVKEAFRGKGKGEKHDPESMENLKTMFGMDAEEVLAIAPTQRTQRR